MPENIWIQLVQLWKPVHAEMHSLWVASETSEPTSDDRNAMWHLRLMERNYMTATKCVPSPFIEAAA